MKIAILGFGKEGQSAYGYWGKGDHEITICDQNASIKLPENVATSLGNNYLANLDKFDLIVRSPSVHPTHIVTKNSPEILKKITTVTNEFFRVCPTSNIIGVTGTKGKGTTSTLITRILENFGHRVHLGGNIGIPPLELLKNNIASEDWVVLEMSNFQLTDFTYAPHVGVCLMVVFEHLDWHADMTEYGLAKKQMFAHQKVDDIAIYYAENENSTAIAELSPGHKIPYFAPPGAIVEDDLVKIDGQVICNTQELKLIGKHNWQNVCAAITTVWQFHQDAVKIREVVINFEGLAHRLEPVREYRAVSFFNDSFAANPDAAAAAVEAIKGKKVLIVGGFDRNLPLDNFVASVNANHSSIVNILLIGSSSTRVASELQRSGFNNFTLSTSKDMPEIVQAAYELAKPGQSVVLSPGFPSFDMFKNFEERGDKYKVAVNNL